MLEIWLFSHLNCILMLNGIVWNRTVFDIETVLMLNWIVWNRTVYLYKINFALNNLQRLMWHKTQTTNQPNSLPLNFGELVKTGAFSMFWQSNIHLKFICIQEDHVQKKKSKKQYTESVNMNIEWMQFHNL